MLKKELIAETFKNLQEEITSSLEKADGKKFHEDVWERAEGGGGRTRTIEGNIIEKGGVAFSAVYGKTPEKILQALQLPPSDFYATGISIVLHPANPRIPIIHMNVRYFEMSNGAKWFGGGIDLTPHYISKQEAVFFHTQLKNTCDNYSPKYYPKFKKWADDYFFIKHRNETRGIGGIFFDRLSEDADFTIEQRFDFATAIGRSFLPIYLPLINSNKDKTFTEKEKQWQFMRRGRYVEFNLVYDNGTKFGLDTNGRTESILMSLPPTAQWKYDFKVENNSAEEATLALLKKDIDWIALA